MIAKRCMFFTIVRTLVKLGQQFWSGSSKEDRDESKGGNYFGNVEVDLHFIN